MRDTVRNEALWGQDESGLHGGQEVVGSKTEVVWTCEEELHRCIK